MSLPPTTNEQTKKEKPSSAATKPSFKAPGKHQGRSQGKAQGKTQGKKRRKKSPRWVPPAMTAEDFELLDKNLDDLTYILYDLETTGGNPERNGITEIAAFKVRRGITVDSYYTLVNPKMRIPPIVRKITGIHSGMLKDAPYIEEVFEGFMKFVGDGVLVSHNATADLQFLRYSHQQLLKVPLPNFYVCTHQIAEKVYPNCPRKSLKGLVEYLKLPGDGFHRAQEDAQMTKLLFLREKEELHKRKVKTYRDLVELKGDYALLERMGWQLTREQIEKLPKGCGELRLLGKKGKPLISLACMDMKQIGLKIRAMDPIPKEFARKLYKSCELETVPHTDFVSALAGNAAYLNVHKSTMDGRKMFSREIMALRLKRDGSSIQISCDEVDEETFAAFGPVHDRSILMEFMTKALDTLKIKHNRRSIFIPAKFGDAFLRTLQGVLTRVKPNAFSRFFEIFSPKLGSFRRFLRSQVMPMRLKDLFEFQGVLFSQFVENDQEKYRIFYVKNSVLIDAKTVVLSPEMTSELSSGHSAVGVPSLSYQDRSAFLWWYFVWRKKAHSDRYIAIEA